MVRKNRNFLYVISAIVVIAILSLLLFTNLIPQTFGAGSYLSIDKVDIIDDGRKAEFRAHVVAMGSEDIQIDFSEDQINNYIEDSEYEATDSLTGKIRYEKQTKSFDISKTGKNLYKAKYENIATGLSSCDIDFCREERPESNYYTNFASRSNLFSKCMCGYLNPIGDQGKFTGASNKDIKVDFSIGDKSETLTSDQTSVNVGNARVEWVGSLSNFNEIYTPRYDILFQSSMWQNMIAENSFDTQRGYLQDFTNCLGQEVDWSDALPQVISLFFDGYSEDQLQNCIDNYNVNMDKVLEDKTPQYENELDTYIDDTKFEGNKFIVDLSIPESYPTFTITVDAEAVGIKELKGEPKITKCLNDVEINSGGFESGEVEIRNIGNSGGFFEGSISCTGDTSGSVNNKFFSSGETNTLDVSVTGENTDSGTLNEDCTITVKDRKSGRTDTCQFGVNVNYVENQICEPGSKVCKNSNELRVCSDDGMDYTIENCDYGCQVLEGDDKCAEEGEEVVCDKWYEKEENDRCVIKDWIGWVAIILIVGILILLIAIIVNMNKRKNSGNRRRRPVNNRSYRR